MPRLVWPVSGPVSAVCTAASGAVNAVTSACAASGNRLITPTLMPRVSGCPDSIVCHSPPSAATRSASASGRPTSWTPSTSGPKPLIVEAIAASLAR